MPNSKFGLTVCRSCSTNNETEISKLWLQKLLMIFWLQRRSVSLISFSSLLMSNSSLEKSFVDTERFLILGSISFSTKIWRVQLMLKKKLDALDPAILTRLWRNAVNDNLSKTEKSTFATLNSSLGWLGTTLFPFSAATASRLQQCLSVVHIFELVKQQAFYCEHKRLVTTHSFRWLCNN